MFRDSLPSDLENKGTRPVLNKVFTVGQVKDLSARDPQYLFS